MKATVAYPPSRVLAAPGVLTVFLAGAIDMGEAVKWQDEIIDNFRDHCVHFLNPRRDDWDSSWQQKLTDPKFNEQVNWELDMIEQADIVFFYFPKDSKAPISLLEFGYVMGIGVRAVVCAQEGYWRRGNLEVMCNRARIPLYSELHQAVAGIYDQLPAEY